jgi:SAM-dependent methyltransferase
MKLFSSLKSFIENNSKSTSPLNPSNFIRKAKPLMQQAIDKLHAELKTTKEKLKDIPGTNYKLGIHHLKLGNLPDAIMRFKMVIYLAPEMATAYYNLGRALLLDGKVIEAKENIQKSLSLQPDFPEAKYALYKIENPDVIDSIPQNLMLEHIEWLNNEKHKTSQERGQIDKFFVSSVLTNIHDKNPNLDILDLGSNTGGRGVFLRRREVAKKITGIDINAKKTEAAKKQLFEGEPVYNNIITSEIHSYIAGNNEKYDLILAGNVFSYNARLDNIFANIAKSLTQGGAFSILIRDGEITDKYKFDPEKDRFDHSVKYFEETLKTAGFNVEEKKHKEFEDISFTILTAKVLAV